MYIKNSFLNGWKVGRLEFYFCDIIRIDLDMYYYEKW